MKRKTRQDPEAQPQPRDPARLGDDPPQGGRGRGDGDQPVLGPHLYQLPYRLPEVLTGGGEDWFPSPKGRQRKPRGVSPRKAGL